MKTTSAIYFISVILLAPLQASAEFNAGAAVVDVTPPQLPVLVNGGMLSRSANSVTTPVMARAIVLDDGRTRIGIVVVDSCMMSRPLLDEAKQLAARRTQIRPDQMLISATHTHSAPASMGCLGTAADPDYIPFLRLKLAQALSDAEANLEPARVGWTVANAENYTALRRWIRRPDRIENDPFGNPTVRANMHAARNLDDVTGPSGPEDPDLSIIALQSADGRPIAVLANFSMHYFGDQALSADYFGLFCEGLKSQIAPDSEEHPPFVGIMSHGCSGDIWKFDYAKPAKARRNEFTLTSYADGLMQIGLQAYKSITYQNDADLAMAEARLNLKYRVPDQQRLEWAQRIVAKMGDRPAKDRVEVYASEQLILHQRQSTEVVVQALRIGDIAIATTPNETYALTGLKLKLQSPLERTMVIELANGGDGYIPPPEQHFLGGYNTWAARSAGLEIQAEPKITGAALRLLEKVSGKPRRTFRQSRGPGCKALLDAKPVAYWRLDEMAGPHVRDISGGNNDALYEMGVVFFLDGPHSETFCREGEVNRAAHFAGGRMRSRITGLGDRYSVSLWLYNGMPNGARDVTGWMFSRGPDHDLGPQGDHLGIAGKANEPGKLLYRNGDGQQDGNLVTGRTKMERWTWNHVALVRDGASVRIYLNGNSRPEIETTVSGDTVATFDQLFFAGRCDNDSNWEGRLDEIAVFDRPLSAEEIKSLAQ